VTLLALSLSSTVQYPAMLVALPLLLAMVVQGSLWCAKDRHFACGVAIPEGFPFDPFLLTSLFVAARVDQLIMWDWSVVLWCPWCVWILAVYNTLVYAIVTGDVVLVHRRESNLPLQEQTYAMSVGGNRYVRPGWLAVRNGTRLAMALTTSIGVWFALHYGVARLNGDVEVPLSMLTTPMMVVLIGCGSALLFNSCVVSRRLIQSEPHRCSYCSEPIALMLQIDRSTYQQRGEEAASSDELSTTVGVLRYEDPADSLERDVDVNDLNVERYGYMAHHPHGVGASMEVPVELVRRAGQAMWSPAWRGRKKNGSGGSALPPPAGETKSSGGGGVEEGARCTICRDRAPDCVFFHCGHNTQCWECARRVIRAQNRHRYDRNASASDMLDGDSI
jgi:hypothetical protein